MWFTRGAMTEGKKLLKYVVFLLVQVAFFCSIIFTKASPLWILGLAIFSIVIIVIAAAQRREAGISTLQIYLSLAGWSLLLTIAWGVIFLLCANVNGQYGWVFGGMLFSLPLGIESASLLMVLRFRGRTSTPD
jgi:hypothetical protein